MPTKKEPDGEKQKVVKTSISMSQELWDAVEAMMKAEKYSRVSVFFQAMIRERRERTLAKAAAAEESASEPKSASQFKAKPRRNKPGEN